MSCSDYVVNRNYDEIRFFPRLLSVFFILFIFFSIKVATFVTPYDISYLPVKILSKVSQTSWMTSVV